MKIKTAVAATSLTLCTLVVAAPTAEAADTRPCVSKTEFQSRNNYAAEGQVPDRKTIETRWEVARMGKHARTLDTRVAYTLKYPACDKRFVVFVQYITEDDTLAAAIRWRVGQ